jgi:integrase
MWNQIGKIVKDQEFRNLLMILRATGCRPIEARTVEAKHVRGRFWVFPKVDSKGQKYNRVVPLTKVAYRITRRLMKQYPNGVLFRDTRGNPWTKNALICRFRRLSKKLGTPISAYCFRHTFCTEALERGVDSTTLATIMGHRDATMVARVYSHLTHNRPLLLRAAEQATGNGDGEK